MVEAVWAASTRSARASAGAASQALARSCPATPSMEKSTMNSAAPTSTLAVPHRPSSLASKLWVSVSDRAMNPATHASTPRMVPKVHASVGRVVGDEAEGGFWLSGRRVTMRQAEAEDGQAADDGTHSAKPHQGCLVLRKLLLLFGHQVSFC